MASNTDFSESVFLEYDNNENSLQDNDALENDSGSFHSAGVYNALHYDNQEWDADRRDLSEYDLNESIMSSSETERKHPYSNEELLNDTDETNIPALTAETCDYFRWRDLDEQGTNLVCTKDHTILPDTNNVIDVPYNWFEKSNGNFIWLDYAKKLHQRLMKDKLLVVYGREGYGKNTYIGEYMHACLEMKDIYPSGLFWVNARSEMRLLENLAKLAFQIGIADIEPQNMQGLLQDVLQWLHCHQKWMIAFYGVSSENVLKNIYQMYFQGSDQQFEIPKTGQVIISTSLGKDILNGIGLWNQCYPVDRLSNEEIRKLILHNALPREDARRYCPVEIYETKSTENYLGGENDSIPNPSHHCADTASNPCPHNVEQDVQQYGPIEIHEMKTTQNNSGNEDNGGHCMSTSNDTPHKKYEEEGSKDVYTNLNVAESSAHKCSLQPAKDTLTVPSNIYLEIDQLNGLSIDEIDSLDRLVDMCECVQMNAMLLVELYRKQEPVNRSFIYLQSLIMPSITTVNTDRSQVIFNSLHKQVKEVSPISDLILSICAFCHSNEIPLCLFVEGVVALRNYDIDIGEYFKDALEQLIQLIDGQGDGELKLIKELETATGTFIKIETRHGNTVMQMSNAVQHMFREANTDHRRGLLLILAKMCIRVFENFAGNVAIRKRVLQHAESCLEYFDQYCDIRNYQADNSGFLLVYIRLKIVVAVTYLILFHLDIAYDISKDLETLLKNTLMDTEAHNNTLAHILNIQGLVKAWKGAESEAIKKLKDALQIRKALRQTPNERRLVADLHKWLAFCNIELEEQGEAQYHLDKADHIIETIVQEMKTDVDPRVWRSYAHNLCQRGKLHKQLAFKSASLNCNTQSSLRSRLDFKEHIEKAELFFKAADSICTKTGGEYRCPMYKVLACEMEGILILESEGPKSPQFADKILNMRKYLQDITAEVGLYHRFPVRVTSKLVWMLLTLGGEENLREALELIEGGIKLHSRICNCPTQTKIGELLFYKGQIRLSLSQTGDAIKTFKQAKHICTVRKKKALLSRLEEFLWKCALIDERTRNTVLVNYHRNRIVEHRAWITVGPRKRHLSLAQ